LHHQQKQNKVMKIFLIAALCLGLAFAFPNRSEIGSEEGLNEEGTDEEEGLNTEAPSAYQDTEAPSTDEPSAALQVNYFDCRSADEEEATTNKPQPNVASAALFSTKCRSKKRPFRRPLRLQETTEAPKEGFFHRYMSQWRQQQRGNINNSRTTQCSGGSCTEILCTNGRCETRHFPQPN